MIGSTLGHYRIEEKLGAGGMGVVYLARDLKLERHVALKLIGEKLTADPRARDRLLREARTASALNHPNVCTVHEVGESEQGMYIVMEHVPGAGLDDMIALGAVLPDRARSYALQIADALAHAHSRGIVHRDLKSSNVAVTPGGFVKVLDFGLARRLVAAEAGDATRAMDSLADPGVLVGTVHYLPPEALRGEPTDTRGDVWAAGVLFYEMLTGSLPFQGRTAFEISSAILSGPAPELPASVPDGLRRIVGRCLEKNPDARYATGGELKSALESMETAAPAPVQDPASGSVRSLVVLPLANLSGDPTQDFFADGMTEAITAQVAKLGGLRVISRTSAMQYKGTPRPLPEIARDLNVDAVVEGSVIRAGNRVRITAQLIHAATDRHLWADSFDRDMSDVLDLQDEVARAIVGEIRSQVESGKPRPVARARRVDPAAYEDYLRGRYAWNLRTPEDLRRGIGFLQKAIDRDPTYALAYAGLADCYGVLGFQGGLHPDQAFPLAEAAAKQALDIDDTLGEAYTSLGYARMHYTGDLVSSGVAYARARDLSPEHATTWHWSALHAVCVGRRDEALAFIDRAIHMDPLSLIMYTACGFIHYLLREFEESVSWYQRGVQLNPRFLTGRVWMASSLAHLGRHDQARAEAEPAVEQTGSAVWALAGSGYCAALAGDETLARTRLRQLEERAASEYVRAYEMARIHSALGEAETALDWLEKAFEEKGSWLPYLRLDPAHDPLRSHPRFLAVQQKVFG